MSSTGDLSWPLRRATSLYADRVAYHVGGEDRTYATVTSRVANLIVGLHSLRGVNAGDVIGVLAGNSVAYIEAWLAVPAAGLVLNPLNFRLALAELEFIVNDSGATVLCADAKWWSTATEIAAACPAIQHLVWLDEPDSESAPVGALHRWETLAATPGRPRQIDLTPETLAAISYTGGTTGRPKGVMQTHGNLWANAMNTLVALPLSHHDRYLHASPMFHSAGAANIFSLTLQGGFHVVLAAFDPATFIGLAAEQRTTATVIVPTMLNAILNHPSLAHADLSAWRVMGLSAAPPPLDLIRRGTALLPCDIRQLYGATETGPHLASTRSGDVRRWVAAGDDEHLRSCGVPDVGVEVEVRNADGAVCVSGEVGELFARGPNVMRGYWNRPHETAAAISVDGWYRTGDLGYRLEDGYLVLVDRAKDMIISGGENVYTTEVENALYSHAAVLEVAVYGVPHDVWGEAVHADVVLRAEHAATIDDLIAHCRTRIAGFKVPRSVTLHTGPLPKSGANKILKRELRDAHWSTARG